MKGKITAHNKNKIRKPITLGRFGLWVVVIPGALALLTYATVLSPSFSASVTGPLAGLVVAVMARYFMYSAYALIFIVGGAGLLYTLLKARRNWRYYALSLGLSSLILGWWAFGFIQQQLYQNHPDYVRYQANVAMCDSIRDEKIYFGERPSQAEEYSVKIVEQFDFEALDKRFVKLYDVDAPIWAKDGACGDQHMTAAEQVVLRSNYEKHLDLQEDLREVAQAVRNERIKTDVMYIRTLEVEQGGEAACEYGLSANQAGVMLPIAQTDRNGVCSVKWVNQRDGSEMTTQELLDTL